MTAVHNWKTCKQAFVKQRKLRKELFQIIFISEGVYGE